MNNLVRAYQINLGARADRWQECLLNHHEKGFPNGFIQRFEACEDRDFGGLGCAKSHVKLLTEFLTQDETPLCIVLEDDFDFRISFTEFADKLQAVAKLGIPWDVLLLAGTKVLTLDQRARVRPGPGTLFYGIPGGDAALPPRPAQGRFLRPVGHRSSLEAFTEAGPVVYLDTVHRGTAGFLFRYRGQLRQLRRHLALIRAVPWPRLWQAGCFLRDGPTRRAPALGLSNLGNWCVCRSPARMTQQRTHNRS